jgi:hypothetical protein
MMRTTLDIEDTPRPEAPPLAWTSRPMEAIVDLADKDVV